MLTMSENFRAVFYAPFYAAFALGAYAAEGVDVALRDSASPIDATAELLSGRVDAMWGGPLRVMLTHAAQPDVDTVCFCDVIVRDPFFVIGRTPRPDFRMADLVGVRFASVAEVPTPWVCLQDDLRRAGIDPASVDRTTGPSMAENAAALRDGRMDAIQVFQPYAEALIAEGAGHIWYAAATRGPTTYTSLVARRSVLEARRDEFAAVVRGMAKTLGWFAATSGAEIARVLAPYLPDVPASIVAGAIDRYKALGLYSTDPTPRREGFERLQAAMLSAQAIPQPIPFETCAVTQIAA
jgi:NitT/TauT family transport system substrate-binding protein